MVTRNAGVAAVLVVWALTIGASARPAGSAPAPDAFRAPEHLAETGLFRADRPGVVDPRNRAFLPQYPLWTDGAAKSRWIYLPAGATIDASQANEWVFPVGTKLWKEFRFDGRRVETRLLWRASATTWIAASYAWNAEGTDATLAPDAGLPGAVEVAPGRRHGIPSAADCSTCHGTGARMHPLGFNALQLSDDRDPNALHGEPLSPGLVTLQTLVAEHLVSNPTTELTSSPRIRTSDPTTRAALGYLSSNCGSCHNGEGEIAALGPTIRFEELLRDGDGVAHALAGQPTRWQIPGVPDGRSVLIQPGAPDDSAILVRMRSRRPSSQMPPLGTVIRDQEALDLLTRWIDRMPTSTR